MDIRRMNEFINLLKSEIVPSVGCTEPVAVALAVAYAKKYNKGPLLSITLTVDKNIYKNGLGVGIPGTKEYGLPTAAALGYICGDADLQLKVLSLVDDKSVFEAKSLLEKDRIKIEIADFPTNGLYIFCRLETDQGISEVVIEKRHDYLKSIKVNDKVIVENPHWQPHKDGTLDITTTSLEEIFEFCQEISPSELTFLKKAIDMNYAIAEEGLKKKHGSAVGFSLHQKMMSNDLFRNAKSLSAGAVDARMSGNTLPVMTITGSGNQGLIATLPLVSVAKTKAIPNDILLPSLALSYLTTIYIKSYTGLLSALCGCGMAAGAGASAGCVSLLGGGIKEVHGAINNVITMIFGMICDGAKRSCSFKASISVETALESALLSLDGVDVVDGDGIICKDANNTLKKLGNICKFGFNDADTVILQNMLS